MAWRIVRIFISAAVSDSGIQINEIDFRLAGVSVRNGGSRYDKASAHSVYQTNAPWLAFDGSTATTYASDFSNTWPQWIQYDFGDDTVSFDEITINPTSTSRAFRDFKILVSQDGADFTEIASYTGLTTGWSSGVARSFAGLTLPPAPPLPSYTAPTVTTTNFQFNTDITSISVPKPSGLAAGDVLVVALGIGQGSGTVITPPSGWTQLQFQRQSNEMAGLYYRVVADPSGEPSTYNFGTDVARRAAGCIYKASGVDNANPIIASDKFSNSSGTPHYAPNLINDSIGALLIAHSLGGYANLPMAQDAGNNLTSSGYTATTSSGSNGISTIGGYKIQTVKGWSWERGFTLQSNIDRIAFSVLLRPRATVDIVQDLDLQWSIDLTKSLGLSWAIESLIVAKSLGLSWSIELAKSLGLSWQIGETPYEDWFTSRWMYGASIPGQIRVEINNDYDTATDYPSFEVAVSGPAVIIPTPVADPLTETHLNYFYADYYFRIWADPRALRMTNPRIGTPIYFGLWNAYPDPNVLVDVELDSLPGIDLLFNTPMDFKGYEYKRLAFEITEDAPVRLDGQIHFEFTHGEADIDFEAVVIDALRHIPNWTIQEKWIWATTVNVSETGKEQRISNRLAPRYALALSIQLPDDMDRRLQYRQLWTFISRTLRVPQWQYMTPIVASSSIGDDRLYLDPLTTDLREGEYAALIRPAFRELVLVRVETIETDRVILDAPLDVDVGSGWVLAPTIAMRMPDGTSISMNAVEGTAGVNFESVQLRDMDVLEDVELVTFEGKVLLHLQPIVQSSENESFSQKTELLDNTSGVPQLTTFWNSPQVGIRRQWLLEDRVTDIHYWRKFCKFANGKQKAFYMPTWRHDLELIEQPALGDLRLRVNDPDYSFQWDNETYKRIQLRTRNGAVYRRVIDIDDMGANGYILTLSAALGSNAGDNEIDMISFLNLVRQDSDEVTLTHDENYSIIDLSLITVNL